eukprot:5516325-Lingulodinium_polyedra.AAC.1
MPPVPPKSNVGSGNAKRGAYKSGRLFRTLNPPRRGVRRVPTLAPGARGCIGATAEMGVYFENT